MSRPRGSEEGDGVQRERFCLLRRSCICATGEGPPYNEWSLLLVRFKIKTMVKANINSAKLMRACLKDTALSVVPGGIKEGVGPEGIEEYCEHTHSTSA